MSKNDPSTEPLIARDATYYRASDTLRARIRASLAAETRAQDRKDLWRWGGMAAAFVAVGAISWNAALLQVRSSDDERLANDVMTAHVRSLMVESHLNDVASSDQHTVKPWFAGKLDFAPRVVDLAASGYTLIGGRLDYLDGRAVAALTYRHRLHVVNVFEWPAGGAHDAAPKVLGLKGYSVVHWTRGGLEYWAISDAAAPEVGALADLLWNTLS
jgi:anti-sigma factor RsiW